MKKITAITILLIIAFSITGCKKGNIHEYEDFINSLHQSISSYLSMKHNGCYLYC